MQTLAENYLTLRLVRLKRCETWPNQGPGFSFILPKGGKGQYLSGSASKSFLAGDLLLLSSADGGEVEAAGDDLVFWCFSACVEHLYPLFDVGEICMLQNTTQNLKSPKLYPASSSLAKECHRLVALAHPQGDAVHRSQVLGIAAAVLSAEFKCARSNHVGFVRMEDHMMQVFEALSPTDLLALPVGDIAHKFSCSRRHLNRLFHQHFGCSVAALRMELRLLKALSLLRNPGLKIISVAEQCGFNHLGLFNACFKKRFGAPPGLLRKRGLDGAKQASDLDAGHPACPLHTQGLCPWLAQEITSTEKLRRSNGPTKDMTARDMLDVSAKLESKSSSGNLVRNAH